MASKPGMKVSPEKQRKPIGSQASEVNFGKPLPVQMTKTSKSEPVTPRNIPKRSQQVVSKQVHVATAKDEKSLNSCKAVYVNSLADKVDSSLSFGDLKDVSIYVGPAVRETKCSQESGGEPEKKVSENGVGIASAKVSDGASSLAKTTGSAKISDRADFVESGKSSMCRGSTSSDVSDESTCSSFSSSVNKPHKANDARWEAIQAVRAKDDLLGVGHFGLPRKLGRVKWNKMLFCYESNGQSIFVKRKKLLRAQTEREILQLLDHPFLPTLYTHFKTDKFSCLVMEFCPALETICTTFVKGNQGSIFRSRH